MLKFTTGFVWGFWYNFGADIADYIRDSLCSGNNWERFRGVMWEIIPKKFAHAQRILYNLKLFVAQQYHVHTGDRTENTRTKSGHIAPISSDHPEDSTN